MSAFHLVLFGPPQLYCDGQPRAIQRRKSLALFIYLAMTKHSPRRERLAALLWPDVEISRGLSNLRTAIWSLKETLGDDWALMEGDTVAINSAFPLTIDVRQFRVLLTARATERQQSLSQAISLYQDDFLSGFTLFDSPEYDDWAYIERENLRGQFGVALDEFVELLIANGEAQSALPYARQRIQLDPLNELAQQQYLRLLSWTGQITAALNHYRAYETLVTTELGIPPSAETEALYRQIAARQLPEIVIKPPTEFTPEPRKIASHLPTQTLPFIGREAELELMMTQLMSLNCRLLTLHGPGGVGKTRLAIRLAEQIAMRHQTVFVSLTPVTLEDAIIPTILTALGLQKPDEQVSLEFLCSVLDGQQLLLVLDNYEHLLPNTRIIEMLLACLPQLQLLITSRERLNLREEWVVELDGLAYPLSPHTPNWQRYSAIELFTLSARRANHAFTLTEENALSIIEICQFVGGLPLGIELAAAWSDILSPTEIINELRRGADILTTNALNVPERQRSVRAVLDYAWSRLTPSEREVMARLSLFSGIFRLDEAQQAAGATISILRRLLHQHLVRRLPEGPYYLHELVRQYAASQFEDITRHHAEISFYRYYADYLAAQLPRLKSDQQRDSAYDIFARWDNIAHACQMMIEHGAWNILTNALEAVWHVYIAYYRLTELKSLFACVVDKMAALASRTPEEDIAYATWLAILAGIRRHWDHRSEVEILYEQAITILDQYADHPATAWPLLVISRNHIFAGAPYQRFEPLIGRALSHYRARGDVWGEAYAQYIYAYTMHNAACYHDVVEHALQALARFQQTGQPWGIAITFDLLGEHAVTLGDYAVARGHYDNELHYVSLLGHDLWYERLKNDIQSFFLIDYDPIKTLQNLEAARDIFTRDGNRLALAWTIYQIAWTHLANGDYALSQRHYQQSLQYFIELGERQGIAWSQIFLGALAIENDDYQWADIYLNNALSTVADLHFPWVVCGVAFVRGDAALRQGNLGQAAAHYHEALAIAYEVQSAQQIMRHLLGAARWAKASGYQNDALRWTLFVLSQPVQDELLRRQGRMLLTACGRSDLADAQLPLPASETYTLAEIIAEVLAALAEGARGA